MIAVTNNRTEAVTQAKRADLLPMTLSNTKVLIRDKRLLLMRFLFAADHRPSTPRRGVYANALSAKPTAGADCNIATIYAPAWRSA